MFKKTSIFVFSFFILFSITSFSNSINIELKQDTCNNGGWLHLPWDGPTARILTIGDCQFIYTFYSKNLGFTNDPWFQITDIAKITGCTPDISIHEARRLAYVDLIKNFNDEGQQAIVEESSCSQVASLDTVDIIDDIVVGPMDTVKVFVPDSIIERGPGIASIDLFSPSATVTSATISNTPGVLFEPIQIWWGCDESICCRAYYTLWYDEENISDIKFSYFGQTPDSCMDAVGRVQQDCVPSCSELLFDWDDSVGVHEPEFPPQVPMNIDSKFKSELMQLSPNPVDTELKLTFGEEAKGAVKELSILSISGREQVQFTLSEMQNEYLIDLTDYSPGTYFVLFKYNNTKYYYKFIKQ